MRKLLTTLLILSLLMVCVVPCYSQGGRDYQARVLTVSRWIDLSGRIYNRIIIPFVDGDTTPTVYSSNTFKTANTAPTTITMFDSGILGQRIVIVFGDSDTTIDFSGTNILGNAGIDWTAAQNDVLTAIFDGTNWYTEVLIGGVSSPLLLPDTDASNTLEIKWNEDDSSDRVLNLLVTSANRSITLEGDTILDQDLTTDSTPTFGDTTITGADPAIIFDTTTATDTDFYIAIDEDTAGDDNDILTIGKGIVKGTTPFMTWDKDGGFVAQNLTDAVTGYQWLDADGGTPILNIDSVNERVGIGTASPANALHVIGDIFASDDVTAIDTVFGNLHAGRSFPTNYVYFNNSNRIDIVPGGVTVLAALSSGNVGINTVGPDRKLDVLDASNPQLRLTHTDGSVYTDFQTDANGDLTITGSNGNLTLTPGTKHDGYKIRAPAEAQTLDATVTTLESITLAEGNTYLIEAWVTATQSDESARAVYKIITGAKRTTAGGAALFGSIVSIITSEEEASWDCTFDADGNNIRVRVTGEGGVTVDWTCTKIIINGSI